MENNNRDIKRCAGGKHWGWQWTDLTKVPSLLMVEQKIFSELWIPTAFSSFQILCCSILLYLLFTTIKIPFTNEHPYTLSRRFLYTSTHSNPDWHSTSSFHPVQHLRSTYCVPRIVRVFEVIEFQNTFLSVASLLMPFFLLLL